MIRPCFSINKNADPTRALLTARLYHFPVAHLTVGLTRTYILIYFCYLSMVNFNFLEIKENEKE